MDRGFPRNRGKKKKTSCNPKERGMGVRGSEERYAGTKGEKVVPRGQKGKKKKGFEERGRPLRRKTR